MFRNVDPDDEGRSERRTAVVFGLDCHDAFRAVRGRRTTTEWVVLLKMKKLESHQKIFDYLPFQLDSSFQYFLSLLKYFFFGLTEFSQESLFKKVQIF